MSRLAKENGIPELRLPVAGAGELVIGGIDGSVRTGSSCGLAIGVTWGRFGESGGVLDVYHVKTLAYALQSWLRDYEGEATRNRLSTQEHGDES